MSGLFKSTGKRDMFPFFVCGALALHSTFSDAYTSNLMSGGRFRPQVSPVPTEALGLESALVSGARKT